jgi:molecular chaperone GrpE
MNADDGTGKTTETSAGVTEETQARPAGETAGGCGEGNAGDLEGQLAAAREEAESYKNEAARAKADFYNYRTRVERDRARDRTLAAEGAVIELLPVLENLERALEAEPNKDSSMYKGVSMVQRQFFASLQNLGLKIIDAGGAFDPAFHEAVTTDDVDDAAMDGMITEQLHSGYMLGDKVLRAARVKVGRKKTSEEKS